MNHKLPDRRVQRTRQLLQEALVALILEKGYEALTVQDVLDRANVGRSTFYAHFRDKEELLLSEFDVLWTQFERHLAAHVAVDDFIGGVSTVMFDHAQNYQRVYRALVGQQSGQVMQTHLQRYLTALMRHHLQGQWGAEAAVAVPLDVLVQHLVSSLMGLLIWWLDRDLPYSAAQMGQMYRQLTQPSLKALVEGAGG